MDCEPWQEAISAMADGEPAGVDDRMLARHLTGCANCRAFQAMAEENRRRSLVRAVPDDVARPDLARRVVKRNAVLDRASRWSIVRAVLAVVAIEIIAFSIQPLVFGDEADTSAHVARHLGAFSVAYGVAMLVVVIRPARARAVLPVAAVLAGTLAITAVIDAVNGRVPLLGEAQHVPELLSVVLVWLLAIPGPRRLRLHAPVHPPLRSVVDPEARDAG